MRDLIEVVLLVGIGALKTRHSYYGIIIYTRKNHWSIVLAAKSGRSAHAPVVTSPIVLILFVRLCNILILQRFAIFEITYAKFGQLSGKASLKDLAALRGNVTSSSAKEKEKTLFQIRRDDELLEGSLSFHSHHSKY